MEENSNLPSSTRESVALEIPAFGKSPLRTLDIEKTREGEKRLVEAKMVSPVTYADLEHCFNEAYRELSRHAATVQYELAMAEKEMEIAKSTFLIDTYPDLMAKKPKSQDSADMRKAYLMRDPAYTAATDRIARLQAMESFVTSRIKVFERVCAYMKKRMDLIIRSGLSAGELYNTQGKR